LLGSLFTVGCHASRIVQNTKISDMHTRLSQGHDMEYIARYYNMDLPHLQNVQFSPARNALACEAGGSLSNLKPRLPSSGQA
jgi:hypothetical protein